MVLRMGAGHVGSSMSQLAKDVRCMMEPDTASRLKVRGIYTARTLAGANILNRIGTESK